MKPLRQDLERTRDQERDIEAMYHGQPVIAAARDGIWPFAECIAVEAAGPVVVTHEKPGPVTLAMLDAEILAYYPLIRGAVEEEKDDESDEEDKDPPALIALSDPLPVCEHQPMCNPQVQMTSPMHWHYLHGTSPGWRAADAAGEKDETKKT
jgi:hypothetical protein